MESQYDPVTQMDALSYQRRYFDALQEYFPEAGERVEIYIGMLIKQNQKLRIKQK